MSISTDADSINGLNHVYGMLFCSLSVSVKMKSIKYLRGPDK